MNAAQLTAVLALTLAVYLLVTDWVNLAPWNNVGDLPVRQKLLLSLTNYTPLVLIAVLVLQVDRLPVMIAVIIGLIDLALHVAYWWIPYLRGASETHRAEHARMFGGTTTFLPRIADHPIPNAQHVVVGLLMTLMVPSSILALAAVWAKP